MLIGSVVGNQVDEDLKTQPVGFGNAGVEVFQRAEEGSTPV